jgi:hypothetical protein
MAFFHGIKFSVSRKNSPRQKSYVGLRTYCVPHILTPITNKLSTINHGTPPVIEGDSCYCKGEKRCGPRLRVDTVVQWVVLSAGWAAPSRTMRKTRKSHHRSHHQRDCNRRRACSCQDDSGRRSRSPRAVISKKKRALVALSDITAPCA